MYMYLLMYNAEVSSLKVHVQCIGILPFGARKSVLYIEVFCLFLLSFLHCILNMECPLLEGPLC